MRMKKTIFLLIALSLSVASGAATMSERGDSNDVRALPFEVQVQGDDDGPLRVATVEATWLKVARAIAGIGTFAVVVTACFAAYFAAKSAKAAEKSVQVSHESVKAMKGAAEGQLFFNLIKEYSSHDMLTDLNTVFDWYRDIENDENNQKLVDEKAKEWIVQLYKEKAPDARKLNKARRHITHFFLNIWALEESKYVNEGFTRRISEAVGTRVLKVVFPLEKALRQHLDELDDVPTEKTHKKIQELRDKFDKLKRLSSNARYKG